GGYTSDPGIFDGEWGFMQIMGGGCDPEYLVGELGDPWSAVDPGISIKPYPSGSLSHPSMDAMRDLILEHDIKPEQVKSVRLGTNTRVLQPLRYDDPQNELEAKFSMKYSLGILLLNGGKGGIAQYRDEVVESPEVKAMLEKVEPFVDEEIEAMGYDLIRSKLTIEMEDGTVHEKFSDTSRGTPKRPMDREELYEKFTECCSLVYEKDQIARAEAVLYKVDTLDGVYSLIDLLGTKNEE
ncbi:MAG: MmgE/PrpD family protein, partial [Nitrospinaceae bacterium]|nr:MmgE/PrpD family protein [Nitrospinaceae bacterium]